MEITLRQLAYFARLAERGSFTAAAQSLGITQPALSIALSQLEKAVGAPLIERGSQPVTLSDYGLTFHRYALRVLRDLAEARQEIAAQGSGTLGRLDLCMGLSAGGFEMGSVLAKMVAEFPRLEIHVRTGVLPAAAEGLKAGEYPVYIGSVAKGFHDAALEVTHLTRTRLVVVAGARHPLVGRKTVTPADLAAQRWIAIGNLDQHLPEWRAAFDAAGVAPPRAAIDVRNIALMRAMLLQGEFVTVLPIGMIRDDVAARLLAPLAAPAIDWTLDLQVVTRIGLTLPVAARLLVERVRAAYAANEQSL